MGELAAASAGGHGCGGRCGHESQRGWGNHAAVHLEHQVVRWFCKLLGWPVAAGGQLLSGASAAALTALTVARHRAAAGIGVDDRRLGLTGLERRPLIYAIAQAHSCHTKAVEALGIGSANIVQIATDESDRMIPDLLDQRLTEDILAGGLPIAVIATVGTVNTGAVDPLAQIAAVCERHGVWMHVDAAYGGPAVLLTDVWPQERPRSARRTASPLTLTSGSTCPSTLGW
jgi:aromatic-L-amino-acid/L-tryptophan decarboxylase